LLHIVENQTDTSKKSTLTVYSNIMIAQGVIGTRISTNVEIEAPIKARSTGRRARKRSVVYDTKIRIGCWGDSPCFSKR